MRNKQQRFRKPKQDWMDRTTYGYEGKPSGDSDVKDHISLRALKDLPKSSYSIKADPYQAALPTSEPYPILNKFNRVVGGEYAGEDNIDGGNVQQYANSTTSKYLKAFDVMRLKINANYRYLPIKPVNSNNYPGKQLIDEMRKSIAESLSILQSTTFTQMAINSFAVETDLPLGSGSTVNIGNNTTINAYTNTTDVIYAMSIYYQLFLQNALSVMNFHNSFRTKQGTMIRNAWNREVPSLNAFFGLMNKKAFLSMLDSINLSFEGEYIDKEFMEQMNMLTSIPSRRSDSITDPVLELQVGFNKPTKFKVYVLDNNGKALEDTPFFDDANLKLNINFGDTNQDVTFWQACDYLRDMLSMEDTQLWARSSYTPAGISGSDNARYNQIKYLFDVIVASFTYFKPTWSDYREAFDVMTRTGTVGWTKGFRPSVTKDTDVKLFWNVLVDHIYQNILSGAHTLDYDEATKRWRTFSLWNMYSGIPQYDLKSGGAFLTLSFKNFGNGVSTAEQYEYLPLLFEPYSNAAGVVQCVALSRDGLEAVIKQYNTVMDSNIVLNRLAPLSSQATLELRVPTVAYSDNTNLTLAHFSNLYKTLTQIFGSCRIQSVSNGNYDVALDPDLIAIYQIEISDITNVAITYARANAPFKGTTSSAGALGFSGIARSNK